MTTFGSYRVSPAGEYERGFYIEQYCYGQIGDDELRFRAVSFEESYPELSGPFPTAEAAVALASELGFEVA